MAILQLQCMLYHCRRRSIGFKNSANPRPFVQTSVSIYNCMSNLTSHSRCPMNHPPPRHYGASNAGSKGHHDHVATAFPSTDPHFGQQSCVCVVFQINGDVVQLLAEGRNVPKSFQSGKFEAFRIMPLDKSLTPGEPYTNRRDIDKLMEGSEVDRASLTIEVTKRTTPLSLGSSILRIKWLHSMPRFSKIMTLIVVPQMSTPI